jgi:glyoxylate reductase
MNWRVFISRKIPQAGIDRLEQAGLTVDVYPEDRVIPRKEFLNGRSKYDALLSVLTESIDQELIDHALRLKIVANYAVGYNNIDIAACTRKKIAVTNTPDVLTDTTADLTFTLILAVAKRIIEGDRMVRSGNFFGWNPMLLLGSEVSGKTLGIIGAGRIGSALAARAHGFNMRILYHDKKNNPQLESDFQAEFTSIDDLLRYSDFVSLHVPLNDDTKHMIDGQRLKQMKKDAFLINTSRGPVIDEEALVAALANRTIAGAGLDVFENEPALAADLEKLPNTVLLPHIGSATVETRDKMALMAAENIIKMANNKVPPNILNKEIFST